MMVVVITELSEIGCPGEMVGRHLAIHMVMRKLRGKNMSTARSKRMEEKKGAPKDPKAPETPGEKLLKSYFICVRLNEVIFLEAKRMQLKQIKEICYHS